MLLLSNRQKEIDICAGTQGQNLAATDWNICLAYLSQVVFDDTLLMSHKPARVECLSSNMEAQRSSTSSIFPDM